MESDGAVFHSNSVSCPASNPLLDQLPSYQSLLYRRKPSAGGSGRERRTSTSRQRMGSSSSGRWAGFSTEARLPDPTPQRPVRELPVNMKEKRRLAREERLEQIKDLSRWERFHLRRLRSWRRFRDESREVLLTLQLWRKDIHTIEGKFGTGILSYFSFLRFLVLLNFVMFILIFGFITLPVVISSYGFGNSTSSYTEVSDCTTYPSSSRQGLVIFHQYIIDLLSGTGFLEQTYLFYGFYRVSTVHFTKFMYNVPLAYLLVTIGYLLLSLLWIVKRSVEGFKQNLVQDEDHFQSFCNKIFAGWDFCITDESAARLKHSSLQYELKTDLEEERIKQKIAERTRTERARIYLLRLVLNLFVLGVLAGCFYAIYRATIYSQQTTQIKSQNFILDLIVEYLPSIVITLANFITPLIFDVIIQFEDYTPAFEIRFTLMRLIVMHCPCALTQWWGQQEFAIPQNVLEIVYGQTICWIGAFYCPLLPAIGTIKYFIIFYIKKVSLMQNCRPSTRPFRASSSNFFFLAVLLIGLAMACVPVGVSIAEINSSKACGPFVNYTTSWAVVPETIDQLPPGLRSFLLGVSSEAFAVPFFVVVCMVMFYFIALAGAHKRVVNQLREQLIMEGRDKRFLIQKLYQAQKESWLSPHHRSGSGISQPRGSGQLSGVFLEQHTGANMTHA
ncbi:UNVERIFIED_CONTAM: hypothetical protein FKN15_000103 [Acipenser sinensis]